MKRSLLYSVVALALLLLARPVSLQADHHTGFKADLLTQIDDVQKQILSLEDAVPQEKYTWRPAEGVRSISEAYLHIAFGNYIILKLAGYDPPESAGWSMDMNAWDKATTDKKAIAEKIKASFDHLKSTINKVSDDDLEKEVNFFGNKISLRSALMYSWAHQHEHLGQSIAYARMNGVVPPWTAEEQKREKEKMEKEKKN